MIKLRLQSDSVTNRQQFDESKGAFCLHNGQEKRPSGFPERRKRETKFRKFPAARTTFEVAAHKEQVRFLSFSITQKGFCCISPHFDESEKSSCHY
jgi:hypothetical protein